MALCIIGRHDFTWSTRDVSVRSVPWAETERWSDNNQAVDRAECAGKATPQLSLLRLQGHELLAEEWKEKIFKINLGK